MTYNLENYWYLTENVSGAKVWSFAARTGRFGVPDGFVYVLDSDVPASLRPGTAGDGESHEIDYDVIVHFAQTLTLDH